MPEGGYLGNIATHAPSFVLSDITMFECLIRNHNVTPVQKLDFGKAIHKKRTLDETEEAVKTEEVESMLVSKTPVETRGHTSYLTFATFLPAIENNVALSEVELQKEAELVEELKQEAQ